jgi:TPR repeat protein
MSFRSSSLLAALLFLFAAPCLAGNAEQQGKTPSAAVAVSWWRVAADQGVANAQNALGHFYAAGMGVPPDDVAAYMWFSLAAAQGDQDSKQQLEAMNKTMMPEQKAEAEKRAREWRPNPK